jgi:hypothetical protein
MASRTLQGDTFLMVSCLILLLSIAMGARMLLGSLKGKP